MRNYLLFLLVVGFVFVTACSDDKKASILVEKEPIQLTEQYSGDVEGFAIKYKSGQLTIAGYILMPKQMKKDAPVVVFNHGGVLDSGAITKSMLEKLAYWPSEGYILLASQYRGVAGSEGEFSFGDGEVTDVLNLLKVVPEIEGADEDNIFMYGLSRGGMVTYQAIKRGANIKAAASVAGISDLVSGYNQAPSSFKYFLYERLGFLKGNLDSYKARSAVYWADKIDVPMLLIHAKHDPVIPIDQTKRLAKMLEAEQKQVKLRIYDSKYHTLSDQIDNYLAEVKTWFEQYGQS
ncbi:alpha/beta hydrolase family protein [Salirhabdus salicampi]|uniref:alpha/beta hydrolase family protein n=1 Tax=Salirhabdus salicampi TaxID=476102 RepID=UPI0020C58768|nr:prolyl oligopeptidase family serine peptidase [Salirhabdus salicampi]MCP8615780.1 prolyl oligopeptidase family serine peptidase [Salirhabdus salicampi]